MASVVANRGPDEANRRRQLQAVETLAAFHARREIMEYVEEDEIDAERRQREIEAADAQQRQQRDGGGERARDRRRASSAR